jgi:hypothetical protein
MIDAIKPYWLEIKFFAAVILLTLAFIAGGHVRSTRDAVTLATYKATAAQAAVNAQAKLQADHTAMENKFQALNAKYEAATHAKAPDVAGSVSAGITGGTLRLRDAEVCAADRQAAAATARSRAADAAATQALADRVAHSIASVRAGDEADKREHDLGEQVTALQGILEAERK